MRRPLFLILRVVFMLAVLAVAASLIDNLVLALIDAVLRMTILGVMGR